MLENGQIQGSNIIPRDKIGNKAKIPELRPATPYMFVLEEELDGITASTSVNITTSRPELEMLATSIGKTFVGIKWSRTGYSFKGTWSRFFSTLVHRVNFDFWSFRISGGIS